MTTTAPHATTAEQAQSGGMPAGQIRDSKHSASGHDRRRPPGDRPGDRPAPARDGGPDRSVAVPRSRRTVRSWPLLILAAPAAVAVWSGWVGIGQMTGFGEMHPLPGIWDSLHIDTAVTLPVGVEAYAAFALRAWLSTSPVVSVRTRRFARWSAIGSLLLGMAGQVAYHLLTEAHVTRAPWQVTTLVSCLPVLVLGLGSALAHLLRSDAAAASGRDDKLESAAVMRTNQRRVASRSLACGTAGRPSARTHPAVIAHCSGLIWSCRIGGGRWASAPGFSPERDRRTPPPTRMRIAEAQSVAAKLTASGQRVSRRSLRTAGLHGSNADLGMLAGLVRSTLADARHSGGP